MIECFVNAHRSISNVQEERDANETDAQANCKSCHFTINLRNYLRERGIQENSDARQSAAEEQDRRVRENALFS